MSYIDYNNIYRAYGELGFPRDSTRAYFDHSCDEFSNTEISEKLLHIGYLLWHGYDMRSAIHNTYKEHDSVKDTIITLLEALLKEEGGLEAKLWQEGHHDLLRKLSNDEIIKKDCGFLDELIDLFYTNLLAYYPSRHLTISHIILNQFQN